jgi:OOP family OmpA-OmpF porin
MRMQTRTVTVWVAITLLLVSAAASAAQRSKETVFEAAKSALDAAESAQAGFFAPKTYAKAIKRYRDAEEAYRNAQNADAVRAELVQAVELFQQATKISEVAQAKLASALKARADAQKVKTALHAADQWERAERALSKAIGDLERDAADAAKTHAAEAEQLYRDAELITIKNTLLGETRLALTHAEDAKVGKYAPKALQKAKDLLAQAEKALEKNRYDADLPRSLVQQAGYEVKHATYLANTVKRAKDDRLSAEDLILAGETPLQRVAAAADINATFDSGYGATTNQLIAYIKQQQQHAERLQQDNQDLDGSVKRLQRELKAVSDEGAALAKRLQAQTERRKALEKQVAALQQNLGGASEERVALSGELDMQNRLRQNLELEVTSLKQEIQLLDQALNNASQERLQLAKRLGAQTQIRERVLQAETLFSQQEARVFRHDNDVVIRVIGLGFPAGSSAIGPTSFPLLAKLGRAIQLFPESKLIIEGHTDSYGGDATNLTLSQKRAEAVKDYLVANLHINAARIQAVGYGETRPVANNETEEGRAKNRRIDVIVQPKNNP